MRAVSQFGAWTRTSELWRIGRFGIVGAVASGAYAVFDLLLMGPFGLSTVPASAMAYIAAMPLSFLGQKHFTFQSSADCKAEFSRFMVTQAISLILAMAISGLVTDYLRLGRYVGISAVIVAIPLVTYTMLAVAVFAPRPKHEQGDAASSRDR